MYFTKSKIGPSEVYDTSQADHWKKFRGEGENELTPRNRTCTSEVMCGADESNMLDLVLDEEYGHEVNSLLMHPLKHWRS